jgi:DNA-binding Lrp family transcriptional regulator
MWFVLATETPAGIAEAIARIEPTPACRCAFPKEREFFVEMKLEAGCDRHHRPCPDRCHARRPAAGAAPYHAIAEQLGIGADEVMRRLRAMLDAGIIRRIGAVPNHYAIGWTANGMTVWNVDDDQVDTLGRRLAHSISSPTAIAARARCRPGPTTCSPWSMVPPATSVRPRLRKFAPCSVPPAGGTTSCIRRKSSRNRACASRVELSARPR